MGLIVGYETIKSTAYYHISFEFLGREFYISKGVDDPGLALDIVLSLQEKGFNITDISRTIVYPLDNSGYRTKEPEHEDLTIERLVEIVKNDEPLPEFDEPIVQSTYRC